MRIKNAAAVLIGFLGLTLVSGICPAADKKELKNETERINYSVGYQIGGDFKAQGVELDPDSLVQGIRDALTKKEPLLSREEMNTTLVNLKKKIEADQRAADKKAAENFLADNAKQKGVTVLPSGIQYQVLKQGSGRKPTLKDEVTVNYRLTRADGKELASTFNDKPRTSIVSKTLSGLQEVLPLMQEGAKWRIVLPANVAAGGREPMDDMGVLIYEMELISVKTGQ